MTSPARQRPALEGAAIVSAWSEACRQAPAERALTLVRHGGGLGAEEVEDWSIGHRDAALLDVYSATFGPRITATTPCPRCEENIEIGFDIDGIRAPYGDTSEEFEITSADAGADRIVFRLPTVSDVARAAAQPGPQQMRRALATRCVVRAEHRGRASDPAALAEEALAQVGAAMAAQDPQADVVLELACPSCQLQWALRFDIADFAWQEVAAEAWRLVAEVHALALAYGWSEHEILQLPDSRRRAYLELVGG
jgi:hypothetical protein